MFNSRKFVVLLLLLMMASLIIPVSVAAPQSQELPETLPNGVAAGDATATSIVLWTHSTALGEVVFDVATDAEFADIVTMISAEVTNEQQPVKVFVDDLAPATTYFYRATDAAGNSESGSFRTPAELGTNQGLRFGVTGDWRGELSPYPSILNVPARDLDFFMLHGDTIYADYPSPDVPLDQAITLEDYRTKHNEAYSTRYDLNSWSQIRSSTVIYAVIDDHEVTNDFAGGASPAYDPRFAEYEGTFVNETELYLNGLQAFVEFNPILDEYYGDTDDVRTTNKHKLYRYRTFGSDAAIFVLDARSYRDEPLPMVEDITNQLEVVNFLSGAYNPERTLLGRVQMEDLKADLLTAHEAGVTWKFVMIPEPIQNLGTLLAQDRFEGYAAERTELLSFINENEIPNVVFISADLHTMLVNNLTYQNGLNDLLQGTHTPVAAWEIITGSVSFSEPLGPTVVGIAADLGLIDEEQQAAYFNGTPEEQDVFMETLINAQIEPLGYSPVGLEDAEGIDAELISGRYHATNVFGWTEFEIDADTQALRVITYGITPYTQEELEANPDEILGREPQVVSEFVVQPQ